MLSPFLDHGACEKISRSMFDKWIRYWKEGDEADEAKRCACVAGRTGKKAS